ncbi:MAG: hypothetical protein ACKVIX_04745 [Sphingomonadales bacterium]
MVKKSRKITKEYLEKAAFYYLGRYSSGEGNLRQVLSNKIRRAKFSGSEIPAEALGWVEDVVLKCSNLGLASDKVYSEMKVKSLINQGKSLQKIKVILNQKKVAKDIIKMTLDTLAGDGVETDQKSALKYAKKRCFGPFRNPLRQNYGTEDFALKKLAEKELSAMIRAGFSYKISKEILRQR